MQYEVEFEIGWIGSKDYKAYYDLDGNLIMYKAEITEKDLPGVAKNAAQSKYPDYDFDDVKKIVKGAEVTYEVEMKKKQHEVELLILHDGTISKKSIN